MKFLIIIIVLILFVFTIKNGKKIDIKFKTLRHKGLPPIDDRFGVYFVTGRQGTGKTYYAIQLTLGQLGYNKHKNKIEIKNRIKIKTNIRSLNIPGYEITHFTTVNEIYYDTEQYCIFIIDELSRKYDKNSRTDTQLYAFLNQCRKMHRVCIMITQEWKELPMWIRRPAKFMITTKPIPLLNKFGLFCSIVGDAENMYLDKDTLEWECPTLKYVIYKRNLFIANMYDTFEAINQL